MSPRSTPRSVVIHGHFYQPPRDDPWLETVRHEPSAAPAHDWNARIEQECYRAVTAARTLSPTGEILSIRNTLEWISFNVGPTLLEWMEEHARPTYEAILDADAQARRRTGWGTALAQPYHHAILPLASPRDRRTEIRWGIADFERRFGRKPLGMWLPETAVDLETLDDLAAEGIAFTIVGDHQVEKAPTDGRPGRIRTPSGREIAVFCYDGALSHGVAFGNLLNDAANWARALFEEDVDPTRSDVVLMATDGETFGHHHRFGDLALASLLDRLSRDPHVRVEPLAAVLDRLPPQEELKLHSPSAWSCSHGVERWASDCGCRMTEGTSQEWRAPLRAGLATLAARLHAVYEEESVALGIEDPWALRDSMGAVVGAEPDVWNRHLETQVPGGFPAKALARIQNLMEMERQVLRSFTSCGWFFDDVAGIEGLQVLRYAARALELAGPGYQDPLEAELLKCLQGAISNDPDLGTAADLYRSTVLPRIPAEVRIAAGAAAIAGLVPHASLTPGLESWWAHVDSRPAGSAGEWRIRVTHRRTSHSTSVRLSVERPGPGRFLARVLGEGLTSLVLQTSDLPGPQGSVVASALRSELVRRWITPADRERLLAGDVTFGQLAVNQLIVGLAELEGAQPNVMRDRLGLLLTLAELSALSDHDSLFDVRTRFHRTREALAPEDRATLDPLAAALGFAFPQSPDDTGPHP